MISNNFINKKLKSTKIYSIRMAIVDSEIGKFYLIMSRIKGYESYNNDKLYITSDWKCYVYSR